MTQEEMNAKTLIINLLKKPLHHCKFLQSSVKCCSLDQFLSAGCELGELWKRQLLCYTHQPFTIPSPVVSDTILFVGKQNKKYEYKYKDKIHICTHQQITVATCIGLHTLLLVKDKYKYTLSVIDDPFLHCITSCTSPEVGLGLPQVLF